jgi:predicted DCC family thiol-disulfide oxidoreductase YuxK
MATRPRATVIYDADCGFCKWCLALLLALDRDGALAPVPLGPGDDPSSWHLILDGERLSAGAALAPALRLLRGGCVPAAAFARFPRATEAGYRWVARHRGLLGRCVPGRARRWAERVIAAHPGSPQ